MATVLASSVSAVSRHDLKVRPTVTAQALRERSQSVTLDTRTPATVDDLIRSRARQPGNHDPIIAYPNEGVNYVYYTPVELDSLVERAAAYYSAFVPQRRTSDDPVQVIGLLGHSDLDYLVTFLAISRLGHSVLLLSTRITSEAYRSLLVSTSASTLLYGRNLMSAAKAAADSLGVACTEIVDITSLSTARSSLRSSVLDPKRESHNISFIIHSSGSTGLPKPIFQTHKASLYAYSQNFNLVGHITLPLYHNHGICCFFRAIWSRKMIYIYNAQLPLTSAGLLGTLRQHPEIKILYAVPYALKLLNETEEGMRLLTQLDIVMFGGSACPKPIGDKLVERGVNLVGHYGCTELGQLMTSFRDYTADKGWDWMRVGSNLMPYLSMEPRGPNLFELCVMDGWPSKVATNRDDGAFATKDLFEPHPTLPDTWRYYARLDDTIVLENGEKANPLIPEGVFRQHENVAEAVIFGSGKPRLGAFIIPAATKLSDKDILASLEPLIQEANSAVPAFAHLTTDMIKILPRNSEYRRTDKGTVIRAAFYKQYSKAIDAAYAEDEAGDLILSKDDLLSFLRQEFETKLATTGAVLGNDTDLFSLGVDSLQTIQVRSKIIKTLQVDAGQIGRNFVFEYPTIARMADEILRIQSGGARKEEISVGKRMQNMIERHSVFDQHKVVGSRVDAITMALTGATGSLGAHTVALLVKMADVERVYCLVRATNPAQASARVRQSLLTRRLLHTLSPAQRSKIVALPSDLSQDNLGLSQNVYDDITGRLTHVLHLAWSVNFNKGLESFEADCIVGVRNLINLCLRSRTPEPAAFSFGSSVSATARTPTDQILEALPASLEHAQGMGYAQSKLVAEHICVNASTSTSIVSRVLRIGQIVGDTQHGVWNETEAIPLIFQSALSTGTLPALDENPTWLPVDVVARACVELTLSDAPSGVVNVVNQKAFHWTRDLLPMLSAAGLKFDAVAQQEWVNKLRSSSPDPVINPSIKLVDFFASKYDNAKPRRSVGYRTDVARSYSKSLAEADVVDAASVNKIIQYLVSRYISPVSATPRTAVIIGGACGAGKSTVASQLARQSSLPLVEGDDLHSLQAKLSMKDHVALTDADREAWLAHLRGAIMYAAPRAESGKVVVTCSALKAKYRDELRRLAELAGIRAIFVMLTTGDKAVMEERMSKREDHYMDSCMVDAQVDALERPADHEYDVCEVDAARPLEAVVSEVSDICADLDGIL